jgi:hypothetical protein
LLKNDAVKVRIVRQPDGELSELSDNSYHVGQVYDLSTGIAEYLVAEGFAIVEMREETKRKSFMGPERRKFGVVIDEYRDGKKVRRG